MTQEHAWSSITHLVHASLNPSDNFIYVPTRCLTSRPILKVD